MLVVKELTNVETKVVIFASIGTGVTTGNGVMFLASFLSVFGWVAEALAPQAP